MKNSAVTALVRNQHQIHEDIDIKVKFVACTTHSNTNETFLKTWEYECVWWTNDTEHRKLIKISSSEIKSTNYASY